MEEVCVKLEKEEEESRRRRRRERDRERREREGGGEREGGEVVNLCQEIKTRRDFIPLGYNTVQMLTH